jgi:ankyrin repeat protein
LAINYAADSSIVQALVDAGADVNAVNKFGQTPLTPFRITAI